MLLRNRPVSLLAVSLLAASLLAACATYSAVEPAKKREIGGIFRVEPGTLWSARRDGGVEYWTVNGFGLDRMTFITRVGDGQPIAPKTQDDDAPTFRAGMTASEVVDLYEAVLASRGFSQVEVRGLRPHAISGHDGFRFDYSAFDSNGLAKRGTVIGLIDSQSGLSLAIYEAASEHYYDATLGAAEKVLQSLEMI